MGENTTLGEALRGDAGIASAMARYKDAQDAEAAGLALCNLVASRAETLGLNRFDAAAAVWAFASLGDMTRPIAFKMVSGSCVAGALSRRLGLTVPDPAPPPPATTAPQKPFA